MKALSFRQPWAELILQGRKTVDLRTYNSHYRGPLAIHAAQTIETAACQRYAIDPQSLAVGGLIGIVDLVDVRPLSEADYAAQRDQHLAGRSYRPDLYGWVLANPRRLLTLIPFKGRTNLFPVKLDLAVVLYQPVMPTLREESGATIQQQRAPEADYAGPPNRGTPKPERTPTAQQPTRNAQLYRTEPSDERALRPFRLEVIPAPEGRTEFGLTLLERGLQANATNGDSAPYQPRLMAAPLELPEMTPVVMVNGEPLRAVADHVIDALRQAGYKATDLSPARKPPFYLPEETGVRLGLLLLAVKPLNKLARIEAISAGIRQMSAEEVYYWYSKCTANQSGERAQKAIRVLLAAE